MKLKKVVIGRKFRPYLVASVRVKIWKSFLQMFKKQSRPAYLLMFENEL